MDAAAVDWTREVFGRVAAAPAVDLGEVVALTEAGELDALGTDGSALWRRSLDARTRRVPPVLGEERAYVADYDESVDWSLSLGRLVGDAMAAVDETVYGVVVSEDGPQRLIALA